MFDNKLYYLFVSDIWWFPWTLLWFYNIAPHKLVYLMYLVLKILKILKNNKYK